MIVGIDEAGRGPLAGSVVSCALYIKGKTKHALPIKDSKSISRPKRQEFFDYFKDKTIFSIGIADASEIDRLNILGATYLSFERAIAGLIRKAPRLKKATYIVDGTGFPASLDVKYRCVVKADTKIREVAYASIVAKLFRDHLMEVADFLFPQWRFFRHKGYPTREHRFLIREHSLSPLHRKTFCSAFL